MKFQIGDIISGLEYCGDTGTVREITFTANEVIYELKTSRKDGYSGSLQIGFNKHNKLMVRYGSICGGANWSEADWKLKKIGEEEVAYYKHFTIFRNEEPDRD